jgi:hypothetical protein
MTIFCDNQSAITLIENHKYHSKNKHVETQYHFTQEKVLEKQIELKYVSISNVTIDVLSKSFPRDKHIQCI